MDKITGSSFHLRRYMSVDQAAQYLGVKSATIYAWVHRQKIPHRKHGARVVFLASELDEWSDQQKVPVKDLVEGRRRRHIIR